VAANSQSSVATQEDELSNTAVSAITVKRLTLTDFRCFRRAVLDSDARPVVLFGANGAGKTSLLEALSMLTPGRGLRGAALADLGRRGASAGSPWGVAVEADGFEGPVSIGTGAAPEGSSRRTLRIDGQAARGRASLAAVVSALWLTPAMDRLFLEGASSRRRFFDRLVYGFDPSHATRIGVYERSMRERARLLRERRGDPAWLSAIEARMAENSVAVAAARSTTLRRLVPMVSAGVGPFPGAEISFQGGVEAMLDRMPALEAEAELAEALAASREHDAQAGGARVGAHRGDLELAHGTSGMPAAQCSTGEQKMLLIALILATARLQAALRGRAPLLLLDEVAAHLDGDHRAALFHEISDIGAQAWLTGVERSVFANFSGAAQYVAVEAGTVTPE
jgi:DNA replication and repair protein RecF